MGSSKKIFSGVIWTMVVNAVNAIYGFISVPILINYFGKSEYGLIGIAMSINVYLQLLDMGFNSTNIRFFSKWLGSGENEKLIRGVQTSFGFYLIIGIINTTVLLVLSFFSDDVFNVTYEQDVILKKLIYVLSISAFFSWIQACFDQLIRAMEDIAWIQKWLLVTKVFMIFLLFATVYFKFSIEIYFLFTCICSFMLLPIYVYKAKKDCLHVIVLPKIDKKILKEILPYSLNIFSFSIFQFSFYNLRPVLLGVQGTVESVADFRVLNGAVGIVTLFGGAFLNVLLPSTSRISLNDNKDAYYRVAYSGTKYISIVTCFFCFAMIAIGPELLTLYVGSDFLYLIPWFNLWMLCTLGTHNQAISSLILAGSDIRAISYSSIVASIVGLITCWFLIPIYQIGGTVIGFAIYMVVQLLFYYLYYWPLKMKIDSSNVFFRCFLPYVLIGGFASGILFYIPISESNQLSILIKGFVFFSFFCLASYISLRKEEKDFIFGLIKK